MTGTAVSFGTLDWAVVGLYFVANTAICVWAALKKEKDTADYFLASRNAGWFLIGSSIFASNIGAAGMRFFFRAAHPLDPRAADRLPTDRWTASLEAAGVLVKPWPRSSPAEASARHFGPWQAASDRLQNG